MEDDLQGKMTSDEILHPIEDDYQWKTPQVEDTSNRRDLQSRRTSKGQWKQDSNARGPPKDNL